MRARTTVTDVLWYVVALAALAGLYPVADSYMTINSDLIPGNTMMILQSLSPLAVVVLLATIYLKARVGAK